MTCERLGAPTFLSHAFARLKPNRVLCVHAGGVVPCHLVAFDALDEALVHAKVKDDGGHALENTKGRRKANEVRDHCLEG